MDPTGYYWQGARYYDPVGGRFLSPDPLGHEASMDLYSYADGDPVNFMDPDGRFGKGATWSAWGALEGTADLAQNVVGSGLYGAMQVADYALGGNDASLFKQYWDNTKAMGSGLAGVAENLGGAGGYWMLRGMDYVSGGNEAQPMQQYWNNVQGMGVGASGGQDRSAAFRWGAGLMAVGSMFVGGEFGTAGKLGRAGEMANATVQAGRMAAKSGGNSFTRFFYDPRPFRQVSTEYWASHGPANGQSLHHWLIPQRATRIPDGIRNAGFNLVQLPAMQGTFHRSLGLNQWMGFARNWGPQARFNAGLVENTIKVGIPAAGAGVGYLGYEVGSLIYDSAFGDK